MDRAGLAQRARIVLLSSEGMGTTAVAERIGVSRPTVILWRDRYQQGGVDALVDLPRPGRRSDTDEAGIIAGRWRHNWTRWESRTGRAAAGPTDAGQQGERGQGVAQIRAAAVEDRDLKFSTDPEHDAKSATSSGSTSTADNAVVVCVDEKSQVQAWTGPRRSCVTAGLPNGTPTTTSGTAPPPCSPHSTWPRLGRHGCHDRHRQQEPALREVSRACRRCAPSVCDSSTHGPRRDRLASQTPPHPAALTPTSGSWLNLVEIFFGIITRQANRRGTFTSVKDLVAAIGNFIDGWNERCQPFVWTKTADEILPG